MGGHGGRLSKRPPYQASLIHLSLRSGPYFKASLPVWVKKSQLQKGWDGMVHSSGIFHYKMGQDTPREGSDPGCLFFGLRFRTRRYYSESTSGGGPLADPQGDPGGGLLLEAALQVPLLAPLFLLGLRALLGHSP